MTPNILICHTERELEYLFGNDFIAHIDGKKALTLRKFYEEIKELFEIPDFNFTLDSLSDSLNDLQWLEDERIVFYFTNTNELISKERDPAKMGSILNLLDATAEDWKWTEDELQEKKEIIIVFEESQRIRTLLSEEHIKYKLVTEMK